MKRAVFFTGGWVLAGAVFFQWAASGGILAQTELLEDTTSVHEVASESTEELPVKIHRVGIWQENGESLWRIARSYYGDPFLWTRIYEANRDRIEDPDRIFPKQELIIPPLPSSHGQP